MIGKHIGRFLLDSGDPLVVAADRVATVRTENNLLHALTLLSTLGYSSVPVLDMEGRLQGQVSLAHIISGINAIPTYDWDSLQTRKVSEVMDTDCGCVSEDAELEDVLQKLVNHNYVSVIDTKGMFIGIATRKNILRRLNRLAHDFELMYDITPKEEAAVPIRKEERNRKGNGHYAFAWQQ
ncbi:MAG TPA: CBS domain-containing protein [Clostridiaceae bacterium]|jgi:predicted transcriptional regulator|nr:CBS domain-containing protein [Clostridiaceae bacterium]